MTELSENDWNNRLNWSKLIRPAEACQTNSVRPVTGTEESDVSSRHERQCCPSHGDLRHARTVWHTAPSRHDRTRCHTPHPAVTTGPDVTHRTQPSRPDQMSHTAPSRHDRTRCHSQIVRDGPSLGDPLPRDRRAVTLTSKLSDARMARVTSVVSWEM